MTPKELKNSILQFAIQGKLVEQIKEEGSAENLYAEIQKEKQKLIKQGKIKKEKELPEVTDDEIPFEIPKSWKFIKLNELCDIVNGFTPLRTNEKFWKNGDIPWFTVDDIRSQGRIIKYTNQKITKVAVSKDSNRLLPKDTVLLCCTASVGEYAISKIPLTTNQQFNGLVIKDYWKRYFSSEFLLLLVQTFKDKLINVAGKTTFNFISVRKLGEFVIPFLPIYEQKRIVEKIEELMPLIDRYEVLYNRLKELNKEFPKKLKNAVLQRAIEGKLIPQIKSEGSADDLYKEIQKEKQKLIKQGKIKKEKELPEITEDEIPFKIPKSWKWVRLGNIGSWGSGATPSKNESKYFKNGNIPWLLTGDLNDSYINNSPQYITKLALEKTSVKLNPKGSILIAMYGATIGKLGILNIEATTNQACCACQTFKGVYNKYLFYFLMAYKKRFTEKAEGGAQPNISKEKIVSTQFSLPPLNEQKRIVEKIKEILPNIEKLEKYN